MAGDQHSFVLLCNLDLLSVYYMSGPMLVEDTEVGTESPALLELTSLAAGGGEEGGGGSSDVDGIPTDTSLNM